MEDIVCHCNFVTESEIIQAIMEKHASCAEEIEKVTGAGSGCGRCQPKLRILLRQHANFKTVTGND